MIRAARRWQRSRLQPLPLAVAVPMALALPLTEPLPGMTERGPKRVPSRGLDCLIMRHKRATTLSQVARRAAGDQRWELLFEPDTEGETWSTVSWRE